MNDTTKESLEERAKKHCLPIEIIERIDKANEEYNEQQSKPSTIDEVNTIVNNSLDPFFEDLWKESGKESGKEIETFVNSLESMSEDIDAILNQIR